MRGLFSTLLLAPALVSALVVPEIEVEQEWDGDVAKAIAVEDRLFARIGLDIGSRSPDTGGNSLEFLLEILKSDALCGYGNVTLDGQVLPQVLEDNVSKGQGSVTTNSKTIVIASWSFNCVKVNGLPDSQLMKVEIESVDGALVEDIGFSVLFRQSEVMDIINIETDLSVPDLVVANPNPEGLRPAGDSDFPHPSIEDDFAELDYLRAQLRELEWLIFEKEQRISEHMSEHLEEDIKDCDSLKCVAQAVADRARNAMHSLYGKIRGEEEEEREFPKLPFKKPHFPKLPHGPKGGKNHTCGPPKHGHGNHTHGNHTHPPHWKLPHHRPLPICRYPPPHRGPPPHHPPPHHGPPPYGGPPSPHKPDYHHGPDDEHKPHGKPPGHGKPDFEHGPDDEHKPHGNPPGDRPDFGHGPDDEHKPHEKPPGDRPDFDHGPGDEHRPHGKPPGDDEPDFEHGPDSHRPDFHHGPDEDFPPPHHEGPPDFDGPPGFEGPHHPGHERPHDHPLPPPHHGGGPPPPPPGYEQEHMHHGGFDGPPDLFGGPGPLGGPGGPPRLGKALQVVKFTTIGFLCAFLLLSLHQRICTPKRRADRIARKEKRRARRRIVHKRAISKLLARISGNADESDSGSDDYEEKRGMVRRDAEEGFDRDMTGEIGQLRVAADVVGEIVAAEEGRSNAVISAPAQVPVSAPVAEMTEASPMLELELEHEHEHDHGEELPAYEDNDGTEMSGVVADGFGGYTPSESDTSSVSDILGPSTKS